MMDRFEMMHGGSMLAHELVIFDCDGVLVDSERITNQVFVDVLNEEGIPASLEDMARYFVGYSLDQSISVIKKVYGREPQADFLQRYRPRRDIVLRAELQPVAGVREVLQQLAWPRCVASNSSAAKVREMLALTDLAMYFDDRIFSAADLGQPKPAPDVYLHAAASFGYPPSSCLVIEDTEVGVRAAAAASMRVYAYTGTMDGSRLLKAGAERVFDNMQQLPALMQCCGATSMIADDGMPALDR